MNYNILVEVFCISSDLEPSIKMINKKVQELMFTKFEYAGYHCFCIGNGNSWIANLARVYSTIIE